MNVQLNSAIHRDIREAMEYYLDTATSQISLDFYEEFQHFAELAARSPLSYRVLPRTRPRSEELISIDSLITFFSGESTRRRSGFWLSDTITDILHTGWIAGRAQ